MQFYRHLDDGLCSFLDQTSHVTAVFIGRLFANICNVLLAVGVALTLRCDLVSRKLAYRQQTVSK